MAKKEKKVEDVKDAGATAGVVDTHPDVASTKKGSVVKITFKIRNPNAMTGEGKNRKVLGYSLREFSEKTHGEDFESIADAFQEANSHVKASKPLDESDTEGMRAFQEANQFNASIQHPILSKEIE